MAAPSNPPATPAADAAPRLALSGITKRYPAVLANDHVDLDVLPGEIHAVLGENGAGKSTLMKIIYGVVKPDAGAVRWEGSIVQIANPAQARKLGIGMVFQHFSLFDTLTVAENIRLAVDDAASATCRSATACRSIRGATSTRCRSGNGSASRSCAACCRSRGS